MGEYEAVEELLGILDGVFGDDNDVDDDDE